MEFIASGSKTAVDRGCDRGWDLGSMWACDVCAPLRGYLPPHKDGSGSTDPDCGAAALRCGLLLGLSVNVNVDETCSTPRQRLLSPLPLLTSVSVDTHSNRQGKDALL